MSLTKYVDVFYGCDEMHDIPADSLAYKWNMFKGRAGNNSPAAALPFGNVTCSPYTGGYSSGYGSIVLNSGEALRRFYKGNKLRGFSHFTHEGVGGIGFYYNYLVTTPFKGELLKTANLQNITDEKGKPGTYACRFVEDNIECQVTVADSVALHRYNTDGEPFCIAIDITNDGMADFDLLGVPVDRPAFSFPNEAKIRIVDVDKIGGYITMQGVKIYIAIHCVGENVSTKLWENYLELEQKNWEYADKKRGGCVFSCEDNAELLIGFSLKDEDSAWRKVENVDTFENCIQYADEQWEKRLSAIQIQCSETEKRLFYSNFYHSLIKPVCWHKESFLWKEENEIFCTDFATLWDVYKTQMPLLFSLYQDVSKGILGTIENMEKHLHRFFNALLLSSDLDRESNQACCLCCYLLIDCYERGVFTDTEKLLRLCKTEIKDYKEDVLKGTMTKTTKLLDVALISYRLYLIAKENKFDEYSKYYGTIAEHWTEAFAEDGLLKAEYDYYEGNRYNYSFRLIEQVEERIRLGSGKEQVERELDKFFALNDSGEKENRFEGFHNETDMETPYFYHYVDKYDKLCTILKECVKTCFIEGRHGVPGNCDSGGLSTCFMWNFMGIFPASGQDKMLFGYPFAKVVKMSLWNGNTFTIRSEGDGDFIDKVEWNGKTLNAYYITVKEFMNGGVLVFYKKQKP